MDMSVRCYLESADVVGSFADDPSGIGNHGIVLRDCLVANYDRLHRRLLRFLGCPDRASDCLHDAWLRLGETTLSEAVQNPAAYVYRVACNVAMDRLRSNRIWQYAGDADASLDGAVDPLPGPDVVAEARSDLAAVERAIRSLPARHQHILMELRVNELTRQEVATLHGMSLRRVDTVLRQALDYCASQTDLQVLAGARGRRRALPQARMRA
jgi:RNA polymerase sigma factor (sigma-70 family)